MITTYSIQFLTVAIIFCLGVSCRFVVGDPADVCGGLIEADGGHVDNVVTNDTWSDGDRTTCVWIIKSLSKQYIDFQPMVIPQGSYVMLYTEHTAGQPPVPFRKLTHQDTHMTFQIKGQTLIVILPQNRNSDQFEFSWSTWRLVGSDGTMRSVNFGLSHHGEHTWTEFLGPQRLTWALNLNLDTSHHLTLNVATTFQPSENEQDPCTLAYFGLYEILPSGTLREVVSVCNRPLTLEVTRVIPHLLGFLYVNPSQVSRDFKGLEDLVDLKWTTMRETQKNAENGLI